MLSVQQFLEVSRELQVTNSFLLLLVFSEVSIPGAFVS